MKRNFTQLCGLMALALTSIPLTGQNEGKEITGIQRQSVSEQSVQLRAGIGDIAITYSMTGEYIYQSVFVMDDYFREVRYRWENNQWIEDESALMLNISEMMTGNPTIEEVNGGGTRFYMPMLGNWYGWLGWPGSEYTTKYDGKGNLIEFHKTNGPTFVIQYDALDRIVAIDLYGGDGVLYDKYRYEYYESSVWRTLFEHSTFENGKWVAGDWGKMIRKFETYQNKDGSTNFHVILQEKYITGTNGELIGDSRYEIVYDGNNRESVRYHYAWYGARWIKILQTIFYPPNDLTPSVETGNNTPTGEDNKGGFDIRITFPADSIAGGSLTVRLPDGLTLDKDNTRLTIDLGDFELAITQQEDNTWLLELKPKTLYSTSLRSDGDVGQLLHVAYTVGANVKRGVYNATVHSILFETPGGSAIAEPAITVPVNVNRWGVGNEQVTASEPAVYAHDGILTIRSNRAEQITIYSVNGAKLYESRIQAGATTIHTTPFPQGVLIVRGSSGWVKKVVNL